jgi:predicted transcriptional regulator
MIGIEQYRKIQEYKALGLAQTKTAKVLGITYSSVSKYWNMSEEDYVREAKKERYHMDNYRQYVLNN